MSQRRANHQLMQGFGAKSAGRYRVGITSVMRRCAAGGFGLVNATCVAFPSICGPKNEGVSIC